MLDFLRITLNLKASKMRVEVLAFQYDVFVVRILKVLLIPRVLIISSGRHSDPRIPYHVEK